MSRENMEFARRWVNRWNAGDPNPFPDEEIHPDVLLVSRGIMAGHPLQGREAFRNWIREIDEQFDEWEITVEEWRDAGDWVAALVHIHLHGRQKDIAFDFSTGLLAEIRDGRMVRLESFVDNPAEALEAAGLHPEPAAE
jgi:ketosteroid isomerase-like protein